MNFLVVLSLLASLSALGETKIYTSEVHKFSVEKILKKDDVIWGMDFLPDRRIIFTVRSGKMLIYNPKDKKTTNVSGIPEVYTVGQGGLLDVRAHPDFSKNNYIYFTYSLPVVDKATTALARAVLKNNKLEKVEKLFSAPEPNDNDIHFGSRIAFSNGYLFISIGDRNERKQAQSLKYHMGKIIRLKEDGSVPKDNPFVDTKDALPEIWSYGHRNPQGLEYHAARKELWFVEFGPKGGDEVNIIKKGENYGWPVVS
jgi:glucose/arabinose dehydrogenase